MFLVRGALEAKPLGGSACLFVDGIGGQGEMRAQGQIALEQTDPAERICLRPGP